MGAGITGGMMSTAIAGITYGIGGIGGIHIAFQKLNEKSASMINGLINLSARSIAHGVFQGGMHLIQGGRFEHGFLAGFCSSFALELTSNVNMGSVGSMVFGAAIGGTAEALGGGKFANGAITGAYVGLFNHAMHQEPGKIDLDKAKPNQVLEQMMKVGRWAVANRGGKASIDDYFIFGNDCGNYSGTGDFWNFQNVEYHFTVAHGGVLNFSQVDVFVGGIFAVNDVIIVNGMDGSVTKYSHNTTFSFQPYVIDIHGSKGVRFSWETANYYNGTNFNLTRSTIQGNRLAGYLTYKFTGEYRRDTEMMP